MSWEQDIDRYTVKLNEAVPKHLLPGVTSELYASIVDGSPLTGSPGQPVGQYGPGYHPGEVGGDLRTSWQIEFLSPDTARVITNSQHAKQNEDGIARPSQGTYIQRSTVGGRHSVALTLASAQKIVDKVAAEYAA